MSALDPALRREARSALDRLDRARDAVREAQRIEVVKRREVMTRTRTFGLDETGLRKLVGRV